MADPDAEVARLMRAMGAGGGSGIKTAPQADDGRHQQATVSPRGSKPIEHDGNTDEGLSAEEARLLRSMHAAPKGHAPAKKWGDPVSPRGPAPAQPAAATTAAAPAPAAQQQPAVVGAAAAVEPKTEVANPQQHVPSHQGEEPLAEVVADPEAVKKKEEEQAAKEAARLERLLAKKFAC